MAEYVCRGRVSSIINDGNDIEFTLRCRVQVNPTTEGWADMTKAKWVAKNKNYNVLCNPDDPKDARVKVEDLPFGIQRNPDSFLTLLSAAKTEDSCFIFNGNLKLTALRVGPM